MHLELFSELRWIYHSALIFIAETNIADGQITVTTGESALIGLTRFRYRPPTAPRHFRCRYIVHH